MMSNSNSKSRVGEFTDRDPIGFPCFEVSLSKTAIISIEVLFIELIANLADLLAPKSKAFCFLRFTFFLHIVKEFLCGLNIA